MAGIFTGKYKIKYPYLPRIDGMNGSQKRPNLLLIY
jgi:hypothetical protein